MHQQRRWIVSQPHAGVRQLAERLKTSTITAQILLNRGISEPQACADFLRPSLKLLHDPSLMPGLPAAAQRIAKAIAEKEKIVIYGDYDVDGITAVAILWHAIRLLGGQVEYYIPHRIDEGYGLNCEAIAQLCDAGAKLIISVDCGITAIEPANVARERGVDLIVTDHHEWHEGKDEGRRMKDEEGSADAPVHPSAFILHPSDHPSSFILHPSDHPSAFILHPSDHPSLPQCHSIVHPRLPIQGTSPYPNPHICGAGVAFKLAWGVGMAVSGSARVSAPFREFLVEATALAALGTIADVVPLVGENRVLAHFGLNGLKHSKLNGIRALIQTSGLDGQNIDCYHAGFVLAPRLNACGRMGHANLAAQMLTDADPAKAVEIAKYLESQNRARQTLERKIVDEALAQIEKYGYASQDHRAIVLGAEGWHPGVIGIVASRIVDRFHRPAVMVALNDGTGQGSGRSISGFHLAHALDACSSHLDAHGGHEMAAGLKLRSENFENFRSAFLEQANSTIAEEMLTPELQIDCEAGLEHMSIALINEMKHLGPFGHGNRKPLLCCRGVTLAGPPRRVGKTGDHLQLRIKQGGTHLKCIAFGAGELAEQLSEGMSIDLAVEPQINEYNGRVSVELMVRDVNVARTSSP